MYLRFVFVTVLVACSQDVSVTKQEVDVDGDGFPSDLDCDDEDADLYPGADERCDGVDQDCDGEIDETPVDPPTWYADADGDGYGDAAHPALACDAPAGAVADATDCDDADAAVHPDAAEPDCTDPVDYNCDGSTGYADADGDGAPACEDCDDADATVHPAATEVCNGTDDDCDGLMDDGDDSLDPATALTWYADTDGDEAGDPAHSTLACVAPPGFRADATDCDDTDAAVNPAAAEVCNEVDDDCDGAVDEGVEPTWYADADADTYGDAGFALAACTAPVGFVADASDCLDTDATVHPAASEVCNGADDDCDTLVDDDDPSVDPATGSVWYADTDGDTYGDPAAGVWGCDVPSGTVADASDCDDGDAAVNPAATEVCNGADDDCDTLVDDDDPSLDATTTRSWYADADLDGYGDATAATAACDGPADTVAAAGDCDDADDAVNPGASETCDGADEDCDGTPDDGASCPCTVDTYGGHAYQFCTGSLEWDDAEAACVASGYHLATLDSAAENTWVYDRAMAIAATSWWFGFNDLAVEGRWEWVDGSAASYTNWASSQPDNGGGTEHCAHYGYGGSYQWNDDQCYSAKTYVCEAG